MTLAKHFNNEKEDYLKGEKSVRNYKRDIPIPFQRRNMTRLQLAENGKEYKFNLFKLPFRTYLGRDKFDKRLLFDKLLKGDINLKIALCNCVKEKYFYWQLLRPTRKNTNWIPVLSPKLIFLLTTRLSYRLGNFGLP